MTLDYIDPLGAMKIRDPMSQDQVRPMAPLEGKMTGVEFLLTWMVTPNPLLGGVSPIWMLEHGKGEKLGRFIRKAIEDNRVTEPQDAAP